MGSEQVNGRCLRDLPPLVAFAGAAGSGKSTAADLLIPAGYVRLKMADVLKDMLRSLYKSAGLSVKEVERRLEGDLKEKPDFILGGKTPRHAMQTLGGDWGRDMIAQDLWTMIWQMRLCKLLGEGAKAVCDDIRYQNEVDIIHKFGGKVIELVGQHDRAPGNHSSEGGVISDSQILNNGTIADLERDILTFLLELSN